MHTLPANAPKDLYQAFAYIGSVKSPSIDDLKLMVLLEAAGKVMYDDLADADPDPKVKEMLRASGVDEMKHAVRCSAAIGKLTGTAYPVPTSEENPYLVGWVKPTLTPELVSNLAKAEFNGEALYEGWASNCPNEEAQKLFRQNGSEETAHGTRLEEIAKLMSARKA